MQFSTPMTLIALATILLQITSAGPLPTAIIDISTQPTNATVLATASAASYTIQSIQKTAEDVKHLAEEDLGKLKGKDVELDIEIKKRGFWHNLLHCMNSGECHS